MKYNLKGFLLRAMHNIKFALFMKYDILYEIRFRLKRLLYLDILYSKQITKEKSKIKTFFS